MKITHTDAYLIDLEPETARIDAIQAFVKQETIFVDIEIDDGHAVAPSEPGIGIAWDRDAIDRLRID